MKSFLSPIRVTILVFLSCVIGVSQSAGPTTSEKWILTNLKGHSAMANSSYRFITDGISTPIIITFEGESGSVSGSDSKFTRFGQSTLIGLAMNKGMETVEVYQIDRTNGKILFSKSRVGTKTVTELLSDTSMAFVGDAKRFPN